MNIKNPMVNENKGTVPGGRPAVPASFDCRTLLLTVKYRLVKALLRCCCIPALLGILFSCGKGDSPELRPTSGAKPSMDETYVDTMSLRLTPFSNQTICNGKLRALGKSVLTFPKAGYITSINVSEGQWVRQGELIATIDNTAQSADFENARNELERAEVALADQLIGLGYSEEPNEIPADVMHRAEIASGYLTAKQALETARIALSDCRLCAPFAGRVANVEGRLHELSQNVCTLVDDSQFDVEFNVLESELKHVGVGHSVVATPFIDDSLTCRGSIKEINPIVDEKGLVKVVARIGGHTQLMDGMNMRVIIEQRMERMFVVPKDAVVERDGYNVVFLLRDGKAVWTYVDILHSNISSYAITGSLSKGARLNEGDIIITSGNMNLADGTKVKAGNL